MSLRAWVGSAALVGGALVSTCADACDGAWVERQVAAATRAEAMHRVGDAIALRSQVYACSPHAESVDNALALARDHAAMGAFETAAAIVETTASTSASSEAVVAAMEEAVTTRLALGHLDEAASDVRWLWHHGRTPTTALDLGTALEAREQWSEAKRWYHTLLADGAYPRHLRGAAWVGIGRATSHLHHDDAARAAYREAIVVAARSRTERGVLLDAAAPLLAGLEERVPRLPRPPRLPPPPLAPGMPGIVSPFGTMTESGTDHPPADVGLTPPDVRDSAESAMAEALVRLTLSALKRWQPRAMTIPMGELDRAAFDEWVRAELTPLVRAESDALTAATRSLTAAIELHHAGWELAAAALLAEEYARFARFLRESPVPRLRGYNADLDAWE